MASAIISQTLQGAVLSMTSNVLAQVITSYQDNTPFSINISQVLTFSFFAILANPPNILWQMFLEDQFPTSVPASPSTSPKNSKTADPVKTETSKTNILIKFILDQTFGAVINTLMFLGYMAYINAQDKPGVNAWDVVVRDCTEKLWPMMKDGYKFWPAISLISFVWIPVHKRIVFACTAGVAWGIYLSLMVGASA